MQVYEQRRVRQAELLQRAAQEKSSFVKIGERIAETAKTVEQLQSQRENMAPDQRGEAADGYRAQALALRAEAGELTDRANAEMSEIQAFQQLLPELEAVEQALRQRLDGAGTFLEMQQISSHVVRMREQLLLERQQIDLMVAAQENIFYAGMRQATLKNELADMYVQCAEVLVPTVLPFSEQHRKIISSAKILVGAVLIGYGLRLAIWLIQHLLAIVKALLGVTRFSVKRITTLLKFAGSIIKLFVWIFCLVAVLNEFGIDYAKSTGAIGLIGLIMASMFQQIVVDFVKGLDIVAGRHYNVGDFIEVDGKHGHVVDLSVKHTRIRTHSGQEFSIPNSRCVPSRRFPDGYVDNYVDITLKSRGDRLKAREVIDMVCADLNRRVEPVREKPELARRFARSSDRITLRYLVRLLPGCDWVIKERFIPAVEESLAGSGVELSGKPTTFFINRIETFRKLFSRRMTEEEIVREVADEQQPPTTAEGDSA